jgi:hypothetical protein
MSSLLKKIILHIILPLVAGFLIYMLTRPLPMFRGLGPENIAIENIQHRSWFVRIIILNGPDFLWSYSFASALFLWKSYSGVVSLSFLILVAGIMVFSELIQLAVPGYFTFDIADLLAAILATLLSYFLNVRNA